MVLDPGVEYGCAVCVGRWEGEPRIGMRWNGGKDNPIGNPQSRGIPTWFMLPVGKYTEAIIESLSAEQKRIARTFLPK